MGQALTKAASRYLSSSAANVTSQFGEDGIIKRIFEICPPSNRWCVEFGAWDGKFLSNTWSLINERSWGGVLIEADQERVATLKHRHADRHDVFVRNALVGWGAEDGLDAILRTTPTPPDFDLLSIDIDGNDFHVWHAVAAYRPRVLIVEFNPTASNQLYFVQDADPKLNQGCSLLALAELGKHKGYELVATTFTNAIFVASELYPMFGIEDNSLDALHEEALTAEIAHGYDGTVFAAGHLWLNWHGIALTQDDYQLLPKNMRSYKG